MSLFLSNIFKDLEGDELAKKRKKIFFSASAFVVVILFLALSYFFLLLPSDFSSEKFITIERGSSLNKVASQLKEEGIIKSEFIFKIIVSLMAGEGGAKSGVYFFKEPQNILTVSGRIIGADFKLTPAKVIIPEGLTIAEISDILQNSLMNFDKKGFLKLTTGSIFFDNNISDKPFDSLEGFLFPDTYFFFPTVENSQIISDMRSNFNLKMTSEIKEEIRKRGLDVYKIITMASLIEEEARQPETRRIVSGILWKRLNAGMPLQVDAVFPYIMGKNTFEVTLDDLKVDSPYNTYLYSGLPKGPIANPGLDSILAAVYPKDSDYWYYLSDKDGNMHYSKTFEEHKKNKEKYLK